MATPKSDTIAKRIIRTIQTAMFGIKSQAREHAFVRGFFALMINDDMNMNPQDDLDLRSHEELVVVDGSHDDGNDTANNIN